MNNKNQSNMPDITPLTSNNHAAIHEDIYLQKGRVPTDHSDQSQEEAEGLPLTINGMISGHGPYDYI